MMKYIRIFLIIISILTLITASLTLCHMIPILPGTILSLFLILCEFAIQSVLAYKARRKIAMISYIAASAGIAGIMLWIILS